jgi:DNA repair protein RecO (recombination protein O)
VPLVRTSALVLRTVEVSETSFVATLFTRELGKVSAMAKGGRRLKSAFQGGLDLLGVSDIVVLQKASEALDLLTEAAPVERFTSLRRDLAALYAGYYVAELLAELTDDNDPHPKLFDAAVVTLRHLGEPALRCRRLLRFELACLRELGHMPALDACAHCGAAVEAGGSAYAFGLATGGVLCPSCRPGQPHVATLSGTTLGALRVLAAPGAGWRGLDPSAAMLAPVRATLGAVVSHLIGRRPRLLPFLELGPGPGA